MIDKYKNFWSRYRPYMLHPEDERIFSDTSSPLYGKLDSNFKHIEIKSLNVKYNNNLKDEKNNKHFKQSLRPNILHSNLFCLPFIGNIENAKFIILYGNPGLDLGDYDDEHKNNDYIEKVKKNLQFKEEGFFCLDNISKNTGAYKYWREKKRFEKIINGYATKKNCTSSESFDFICRSTCLLESVAYHSPETPNLRPSDLPSSRLSKKLLHRYLLPKAREGKLLILSWRQSSFWDLKEEDNVIIRKNPRGSRFENVEVSAIVNFLSNF